MGGTNYFTATTGSGTAPPSSLLLGILATDAITSIADGGTVEFFAAPDPAQTTGKPVLIMATFQIAVLGAPAALAPDVVMNLAMDGDAVGAGIWKHDTLTLTDASEVRITLNAHATVTPAPGNHRFSSIITNQSGVPVLSMQQRLTVQELLRP
jgi:hypothetical protein